MQPKSLLLSVSFILLIVSTILITYFTNSIISSLFYLILLIAYAKSNNESFWLAFFLTTTDGFFGFLGLYSTVITAIPGLPGIELAQFYILFALFKTFKTKQLFKNHFSGWLTVLFCYSILLVILGQINGLHGEVNAYFKIAKLITPLLLFYTTPRLITSLNDFAFFFKIISIVFIIGFIAQIITVFTGYSPANNYLAEPGDEMEIGRNLRSFYNPIITLLSLLSAMLFLSIKNQNYFSKIYLNTIMLLCFFMAFLSATRGWIIGMGLSILLFNVLVSKFNLKNSALFLSTLLLLIILGFNNDKIKQQILFSLDRGLTIEGLFKGDKTAGGTLARLDERGPKVIAAWEDNPVFGWGFSDVYFEKQDGHVGNLNLLMHSGIIGAVLMFGFILFFNLKLIRYSLKASNFNKLKKSALVIPVFFIGWFFIHSTSSQQFAFFGMPLYIFPQAILLSIAYIILKANTQIVKNE